MNFVNAVLFLALSCPAHGSAQTTTFNRVRYQGGTIPSKISPEEIRNKLVVGPEITLSLDNGQLIKFSSKQATSLSYGQEAAHRLGLGIAIGVISPVLGAMVALHKSKQHMIGIDFTDDQGLKQGILLQADKSNYRSMLSSLQAVTGLPVDVREKEQSAVAGLRTRTAGEPSPQSLTAPTTSSQSVDVATTSPSGESRDSVNSLWLTSAPDGAEVYLDGSLVSNTPVGLKLKSGKHTIRVKKPGYADWSRKVVSQPGFELRLAAVLEPKK
jgi:hypothetical protein